jgi:Cu(I)-responsive transcriptional regulator
MTRGFNIGEAARRSGLPPKTIRYYDEIGLVRPAARAINGYRAYDAVDIHKLRFVRHARDLGFSVEDCGALLSLYEDQTRAPSDVRAMAAKHIATIEAKISELTRMRATLSHLTESCATDARPTCPILDGMADGHTPPSPIQSTATTSAA